MKYEKCPICEEKLRNGICPMCGYDFKRLGQSRTMKDGHWDILTTDKRTNQPAYVHDEKRHPDFKRSKNTVASSKRTRTTARGYKKEKKKKKSKWGIWAVGVVLIYLIDFLSDLAPEFLGDIKHILNQIISIIFS